MAKPKDRAAAVARKLKPKLIRDMDPKTVVFTDCNVCGRELIYSDEERMGMCRVCADE